MVALAIKGFLMKSSVELRDLNSTMHCILDKTIVIKAYNDIAYNSKADVCSPLMTDGHPTLLVGYRFAM